MIATEAPELGRRGAGMDCYIKRAIEPQLPNLAKWSLLPLSPVRDKAAIHFGKACFPRL